MSGVRTLLALGLLTACGASEGGADDSCRNAVPSLVSAGRYGITTASGFGDGGPPDLASSAELEVALAENTVRVTYRDAAGRAVVDSYRITKRERR